MLALILLSVSVSSRYRSFLDGDRKMVSWFNGSNVWYALLNGDSDFRLIEEGGIIPCMCTPLAQSETFVLDKISVLFADYPSEFTRGTKIFDKI